MAYVIISIVCYIFVPLSMLFLDNGGIVRNYHCPDCPNKSGPDTYVPLQTSAPKCDRCGRYMVECED